MFKKNVTFIRSDTPVSDDSNTATDNLSWGTGSIELSKADPFTEFLSIANLDERNLLFRFVAKSFNELNIRLFSDRVTENTKNSITSGKCLGSRSKTTSKSVMDKGILESALKSFFNGNFALGSGLNGDFLNFNFNVRL